MAGRAVLLAGPPGTGKVSAECSVYHEAWLSTTFVVAAYFYSNFISVFLPSDGPGIGCGAGVGKQGAFLSHGWQWSLLNWDKKNRSTDGEFQEGNRWVGIEIQFKNCSVSKGFIVGRSWYNFLFVVVAHKITTENEMTTFFMVLN